MSSRPKNTVHVGGLPTQCDESTLYTYFEPFGEIMQVQIPKLNQQATSHRGFGFVMFSSDDEAEGAIDNMHLNEIEGVSPSWRRCEII
jgi:RNA recognition motif-containing protein